jgi:hypothetical protein
LVVQDQPQNCQTSNQITALSSSGFMNPTYPQSRTAQVVSPAVTLASFETNTTGYVQNSVHEFEDKVEEFCQRITKDTRTIQPTASNVGLLLPPMSSNASISSPSFPLRVTPLLHSFDDLEESDMYTNNFYRRPLDTMQDQQPCKRTRYEDGVPQNMPQYSIRPMQPEIGNLSALLTEPAPNVLINQKFNDSPQTVSPLPKLQAHRKGKSKKDVSPTENGTQNNSATDEGGRKKHFLNQESVSVLKAWFYDNLDHPYPTSDQKEQLSKQTGLTYLQVSNWFTNSRKYVT